MGSPSADSVALSHQGESVSNGQPPPAKETLKDNGTAAALMALKGLEKTTIADDNQGEEYRPPLPPRPSFLGTNRPTTPSASGKPALQSVATTQLSSIDIQTLSFPDGTRGTFSLPAKRTISESVSGLSGGHSTPSRKVSHEGREVDDNASLMSYAPTLRGNGDLASLLDDGLNAQSPAWRLLSTQTDTVNPFETSEFEDVSLVNFVHEFDEIDADGSNRGDEGIYSSLLVSVKSF